MYCNKCGNNIPSGSQFCPICGAIVEDIDNREEYHIKWEGKIFKCPNCGERITSFTSHCPSCGYELRGIDSASSVEKLSKEIQIARTDKEIVSLVRTFPIPNSKEDILEFLILALSNIDDNYQSDIAKAWNAKFEQAYEKAIIVCGDIPEIERCYQLYLQKQKNNARIQKDAEKRHNKDKRAEFLHRNRIILGLMAMVGLFFVLLGITFGSHGLHEWKLKRYVRQTEDYIEAGEYMKATNTANLILADSFSEANTEKWENIKEDLLIMIKDKQAFDEGEVFMEMSHKDFEGKNYIDVQNTLKKEGFTNIELKADKDIVLGWFAKKDEVDKVTINGDDKFEGENCFPMDSKVVIIYHSEK